MRSLGGVYFFDLCVCFLDRERVGVVCLCRFYSVVCVVWHVACGGVRERYVFLIVCRYE